MRQTTEWMENARCLGALETHGRDLFFSEDPADRKLAKRTYCAQCPVAFECLRFAVRNGTGTGIYAGMDGNQLYAFVDKHRRASPEAARVLHDMFLSTI